MSSQTTKLTTSLIVLKGTDNYFKWASTMKAYFMVQGLWKIVSVKDNKPVLKKIPKVAAVFGGANNSDAET